MEDKNSRKSIGPVEEVKTSPAGLKGSAATGIVIIAPFLAIFLVVKWFLGIFSGIPGDELFYITPYLMVNQLLKTGAITILAGAVILFVGKFASTSRGDRFEKIVDIAVTKLPLIGPLYRITKTATDTVLRRTEDFKHPVRLSYQGLYFTAFQTGKDSKDGKKRVFVPTSPNITSGFVIEVDEDRIEETDETLEQAFTRVLSAGFSG